MITVLTGPNTRALLNRLRTITDDFIAAHGDSVERFDGSELTTADGVLDAVRSISFLEPRKLVIVRNFGQSSDIMDTIEDIVSQTADTTDLVLVDFKLDKRTAGYKYLQKNINLEVFSELSPRDLASWAVEQAATLGAVLSAADAQYLVERVGTNQQYLEKELEKLALFRPEIDRKAIDALTDQTPQGKVFDMLEELFRGNHAKAWRLYEDQRAQGEEPHKLLAMITWQLQQLTIAVNAPRQDSATLAQAGISSYSASKVLSLARRITKQQLRMYVDELAQIDLQTKTSADVESALAVYFAQVTS